MEPLDFNPWRDYDHVTSSFQQEQCPIEGVARSQKSSWTWADYCCCVGLAVEAIILTVLLFHEWYKGRNETREERRQRREREAQEVMQRPWFVAVFCLSIPEYIIIPLASKLLLNAQVDLNTDTEKQFETLIVFLVLTV